MPVQEESINYQVTRQVHHYLKRPPMDGMSLILLIGRSGMLRLVDETIRTLDHTKALNDIVQDRVLFVFGEKVRIVIDCDNVDRKPLVCATMFPIE